MFSSETEDHISALKNSILMTLITVNIKINISSPSGDISYSKKI